MVGLREFHVFGMTLPPSVSTRLQHTTDWLCLTLQDEMRATLQDSLAAKDEEIASLALQLQRMEAALRAVERMLYGMRKPTRLDRASLDAVSIHQLQAAVDNFAAVGEAGIMLHQDMMAAGNAQ